MADTSHTIEKMDKALEEYYKRFGDKNYKNDDGVGKFAEYAEENGVDDDGLEDEFGGDIDDCTCLEFDDEFPLNPPIDDEDKRNAEIYRILRYCYENNKPPAMITFNIDSLNVTSQNVTNKVVESAKKRYESQTPDIIGACAKEEDVMYFLAARDVNNGFEFLPNIVDAFTRDRAIAKFKGQSEALTVVEWSKTNPWLLKLKKSLAKKIENGINGYCNRISPLLTFNHLYLIDDSIEKVANYLVLASNFITNLIESQNALPPFQFDAAIAVKKLKSTSNMPSVGMDDDDDDDDDEEKDDPSDAKIGDFYGKIKHEKLSHITKDVEEQKEINDSVRTIVEHFNQFKGKLATDKPQNANKKDPNGHHTAYDAKTYPHKKRFNAFIDRREEKDQMTFYEPPHVCDTMPSGHVPEWYFESSRKCIIPNTGFGDGSKQQQQDDKQQDLGNTTITSQTGVGGTLLTFSFHVEEADHIKCYMYWNGQTMRFYPKDLIQTFKFLFTEDRYKAFESSKKYEKIAKQINITDPKYEAFYNGLDEKNRFFKQ